MKPIKIVETIEKTTWTLNEEELITLIILAVGAPSNASVEFDVSQDYVQGVVVRSSVTSTKDESTPVLSDIEYELMNECAKCDGLEVPQCDWGHMEQLMKYGLTSLSGARGLGRNFKRMKLTDAGRALVATWGK